MAVSVDGVEVDRLRIEVWADSERLGEAAARYAAETITEAVLERGSARVIIATGNSQLAFVRHLRQHSFVPWESVTVFHLDEYLDLDAQHPAGFRRWIRENVSDPLQPKEVHYIDGNTVDADAECHRYEELLREAPLDLVCMGIGENGHIAFNEPHDTDFDHPAWVRIITLQHASRLQQVNEGHFSSVATTPERAITLTIPALLAPRALQIVAPEQRKAAAVRATLTQEISPACPATILRRHHNATLFLDRESASEVDVTDASAPERASG